MTAEHLPFEAQRAWLDRVLLRDDTAREALLACARWTDPEPFALAVAAVVETHRAPALADALGPALAAADDTALLRALRKLDARALPHAPRAGFAEVLLRVCDAMPVDRIEARCLLERWLRRGGFPWRVDDTSLLSLTGAELRARAAVDPAAVSALGERVLEVLSRAPRSLSQAHAEELLAARVYTSPSHFFEELLQNADDAGATTFRVAIDGDELAVSHDGAPFAPRDVVGVLSVGQSTKAAGQIGTFGVGFKSVYAVCARPRVYSGPFAFEIADVSRPRPLRDRPAGLDPAHTAIVLPLSAPQDSARGADAALRHARALPIEVLLTLRNVRALTVVSSRCARAVTRDDGTIELRDDTTTRAFLPRRHGDALVLVELGRDGGAVPVKEGLPTLYAFLPTLERTGLRVRVQCPFEVPVDRERVDLSHPTNASLLGDVASAYTEALRDLRGRGGWSEVAPLPAELAHPALRAMASRVGDGLQHDPVLRAADGAWADPARACLLDDASLVSPLAGFELTLDGRRPLPHLNGRDLAAARWLRVPSLGPEALCAWLVRAAITVARGDRTRAAVRAVLASVAPTPESGPWLRGAAVALDDAGELARPDQLARGDVGARAVYRGLRPLLDEALDPLATASAPPSLTRLWDALGVVRLTPEQLRNDLATEPLRTALLQSDGASRALRYAEGWDGRALSALGRLAVVPCEDGAHRALVGDGRAWLRPAGALGHFLAAETSSVVPLVRADVAHTFGATLARMGAVAADLDTLRAAGPLSPDALRRLYRVLSAMRDELAPSGWARVAAAPWFLDRGGRARALTGRDAALWSASEAIEALVPDAPWLHEDVLAPGFLAAMPAGLIARVGARELVRALAGDAEAFGGAALGDTFVTAAMAWLAANPAALHAADRDVLARTPVWADTDGVARALHAARWPAEMSALARLYAAWRVEPVLGEEAARAADVLGLRAQCQRCDADALLDDLEARDPSAWPARELVADAVRAAARGATEAWRKRAAGVAMLRAEDGALAEAGALHREREAHVRALVRALGGPLLAAEEEALWGSALDALGPFASTSALVRSRAARELRPGVALAEQPPWARAPDALRAVAEVLRGDGPRWWEALAVALNVRGELCAPPLFTAAPDVRSLCEGTSLARSLSHPSFVSGADEGMVKPLPLRRITAALEEGGREATRREGLYAWLLAHSTEIAGDPEARASLGRACVIPSRGGVRRPPGEFLHDDDLPDLGLDWNVADEVPGALRVWLRETYGLEAARLTTLVRHLLEGFARASEAGDEARMEALLGHLARAVRTPEALASLPRGLKVHRAVTVAAHDGTRHAPRELVAVPPDQRAWVARMGDIATLSARYDDDDASLRDFLRALGVEDALPAEPLRALLDGRGLRAGHEARLSLARYVATTALARPSLRPELDLDRRAWVPDDGGGWQRPGALLWPSGELDALVGTTPGRRVNEAFALAVPAEVARWLPFGHAATLSLADVLRGAAGALSATAMRWIERALTEGRLTPSELRKGLSGRRLVPDDGGAACAPAELFLEGEGHGCFGESAGHLPRISEALRVPETLPRVEPIERTTPAIEARPTPAVTAPEPREAARGEGLLGRFRSWLRGDDGAPAPVELTGPQRGRGWYAPTDALDAQTEEATGWLRDRAGASDFGFVHTPRALPAPYVYAPKTLARRFDRTTQRWLAEGPCDPAWRSPGAATGARVAFRGVVPAGAGLVLPMPLYGALSGGAGDGVLETSASGELRYRAAHDGEVEFSVTLGGAPVFEAREEAVAAPAELTALTCPDDELPREVLTFAEAVAASPDPAYARALDVRDFVRASYRYDPRYLEDASVAAFLAELRRGRANGALAALHAGRTGRHLGAGVCFELNALVCELLRRAGVPAAVCTGWVLDDGAATEADHLWAMALLPTARGPRWMPLDASSTREGRPLRTPRRAAPKQVRAPAAPPLPAGGMPPTPTWAASARQAPRRSGAERGPMPQGELVRVARYVESVTGERPASEEALRRACRALLDDPARARELLGLLRGGG